METPGGKETGLPFGQEAVDLARQLGDDILLAGSLTFYALTIDSARSVQLYAEAITLTERSGDRLFNSLLHNGAGFAALSIGDIPAARTHLEAAARSAEEIGMSTGLVSANMGLVLRADGDPDGARSALEAALRSSRRSGGNLVLAGGLPWPGVPGRPPGRLALGSCPPRRCASLSRPHRNSVGGVRRALSPGQPRRSARPRGR